MHVQGNFKFAINTTGTSVMGVVQDVDLENLKCNLKMRVYWIEKKHFVFNRTP